MTIIELSCPEAWQQISELIDGTLPEAMRVRMELHLLHCAHCKAVLDGTRNAVRPIGDDQWIEVPDGFGERLFNRLREGFCHS